MEDENRALKYRHSLKTSKVSNFVKEINDVLDSNEPGFWLSNEDPPLFYNKSDDEENTLTANNNNNTNNNSNINHFNGKSKNPIQNQQSQKRDGMAQNNYISSNPVGVSASANSNNVNNMFNNISIGGNNGGGQINNKQSGDSKIKPKQSDGSMVKGSNPASNQSYKRMFL